MLLQIRSIFFFHSSLVVVTLFKVPSGVFSCIYPADYTVFCMENGWPVGYTRVRDFWLLCFTGGVWGGGWPLSCSHTVGYRKVQVVCNFCYWKCRFVRGIGMCLGYKNMPGICAERWLSSVVLVHWLLARWILSISQFITQTEVTIVSFCMTLSDG